MLPWQWHIYMTCIGCVLGASVCIHKWCKWVNLVSLSMSKRWMIGMLTPLAEMKWQVFKILGYIRFFCIQSSRCVAGQTLLQRVRCHCCNNSVVPRNILSPTEITFNHHYLELKIMSVCFFKCVGSWADLPEVCLIDISWRTTNVTLCRMEIN